VDDGILWICRARRGWYVRAVVPRSPSGCRSPVATIQANFGSRAQQRPLIESAPERGHVIEQERGIPSVQANSTWKPLHTPSAATLGSKTDNNGCRTLQDELARLRSWIGRLFAIVKDAWDQNYLEDVSRRIAWDVHAMHRAEPEATYG
jgi:hypothetical protein